MSKSSISQVLAGKQDSDGLIVRIKASVHNLNTQWLITGIGEPFQDDKRVQPDNEEEDLKELVRKQKEELARMADQLMREKKLNDDLMEVLKKISAWKDVSEE